MFWVPDEDHPPFGRIQVDPAAVHRLQEMHQQGAGRLFLDGCPWDAIAMVDTTEVEQEVGAMPY